MKHKQDTTKTSKQPRIKGNTKQLRGENYHKFFIVNNTISVDVCLDPQIPSFLETQSTWYANQINLKELKTSKSYMSTKLVHLKFYNLSSLIKRTWRSASRKAEYVIKSPWLSPFKKANASISVIEAFRS